MTGLALSQLAMSVVLGGALGVGIALLVSRAPRWGAPSLSRRIAPYIRDVTDPRGTTAWALADSAFAFDGLWRSAQQRFSALIGGSQTIERRLRQACWSQDVAAFRGRQLAWAVGGVLIGGILVVIGALLGAFTPGAALVPPMLGVAGAVLADVRLTRAARARVARMEEELPTVLEFLALCLSAGEGLLDSLRRVGEVAAGDLTSELRAVVLAVGTGSPLAESLSRFADKLQIPALSRSVDHLVAAIDRGAPLAQVLQAQAVDAREDAKRGLIEQSGRKEILMLVPLVFLILPLSILFAVFPGVFMLRLGIG
ncbi:type II secretion protein F [Microbacterium sp. Root61]|uniref:type II secretion system F family protein n=1 Tax=Microbacterium sp. Root61 TaxID=1736570 RepID=UPI0006FB0E84|nr:type II secretion system F family protein [Microbacterium sp. Root61]KRA23718.1 type II secretion protein F [Microbacterium sp. Root61]